MKMNLSILWGNGKKLKNPKVYKNIAITCMGFLQEVIAIDESVIAKLAIVKNFKVFADGFLIEGLEDKSTTKGLKYTFQEWYCWFPQESKK